MKPSFELSKYLQEGWELLLANLANFIVATLMIIAINFAAGSLIPFIGGLIVSGPLMGGMYYMVFDARRGKEVNVLRLFDGFKFKFVPLVLVGILTTVFTMAGAMLFILPGFLVAGWYLFAYINVTENNMDFWPAMEKSREVGFENHLGVFLLIVVICFVNMAGALAMMVGLIVTIPYSFCVTVSAYEHMTGASGNTGQITSQNEPPDVPSDTPPPPSIPQ